MGEQLDALVRPVSQDEVVDPSLRNREAAAGLSLARTDASPPKAKMRASRRRLALALVGVTVVAVAAVAASRLEGRGATVDIGEVELAANVAWFAAVAPADVTEQQTYASCMSADGYDMTEIGPPPVRDDGTVWSDEAFEESSRRCIVSSGLGEIEGDSVAEVASKNAKALGITECMRTRGWEMPAPTRHPVRGYLLPGSPMTPPDATDAASQLRDLTECAAPFGVEVFTGENEAP